MTHRFKEIQRLHDTACTAADCHSSQIKIKVTVPCGKHSRADSDMCEIQLQTCCGCTVCVTQGGWRKRQPGGDPVGSAEHKSQWPGLLPRVGIQPPTLQKQLMVTHHRHSVSQVRRNGLQYTLLATSLYNSCPGPKIEYSNSTCCFISACKKWKQH